MRSAVQRNAAAGESSVVVTVIDVPGNDTTKTVAVMVK
jgi:hypothetical protein